MALIVEAASLAARVLFSFIVAAYHLIIPRKLTPVVNKIVLITGTAQGIGKELAKQYGNCGAKVICVDVNSIKNEETIMELQQQGIKAYSYTCDVANLKEVKNLAEMIKKDVGTVNILVNNAGIVIAKPIIDYTEHDIRSIFNVNIISQFWILKVFLPDMIKQRDGQVVSLSSAAGMRGVADLSAYAATKFAVRGLMLSLQEEYSKYNNNVQFTTVSPLFVATEMLASIPPSIRFPSLFKVKTAEDVAKEIITAQRQKIKEITIPRYLKLSLALLENLPESAQNAFSDFLIPKIQASKTNNNQTNK